MLRTILTAVSVTVAALALAMAAQRGPLPPITATATQPVSIYNPHGTDVHQPQTWPTETPQPAAPEVQASPTYETFTVPAVGTYVIYCERRYNEFVGYWWDMCLPATMTPSPAYP